MDNYIHGTQHPNYDQFPSTKTFNTTLNGCHPTLHQYIYSYVSKITHVQALCIVIEKRIKIIKGDFIKILPKW